MLFEYDVGTGERFVYAELPSLVPPEAVSVPVPAPGPRPKDGPVHALLTGRTTPSARPPDGERPPLLVMSHGGPTSAT